MFLNRARQQEPGKRVVLTGNDERIETMAVDRDPYDRTNAPLGTGMPDRTGMTPDATGAYDQTDTTGAYGTPARRGNTWAWAIGALVVLLALFALFGLGGRDADTTASTTTRPAVTAPATGSASRPATTAPAAPASPSAAPVSSSV